MSYFYTSVERNSNEILSRGYKDGRPFSKREKFKPVFYLPTKQESKYRSLVGEIPLKEKEFESMSEAKEYLERYKDVEGISIYGDSNFISQYMSKTWPGKINYDISKINRLTFDIEVDISDGYGDVNTADKPITSISMKYSKQSTYHLLTLKDYDKTKTETDIDPDDILWEKFDTEELLLKRFIQIWTGNYPDVVTGYNVEYFDIMYTVTRIIRLFGEAKAKELSPWNYIRKQTRELFNRPQSTYSISGITIIDFMDCFKKFGYKYGTLDSYKLDNVAYVVLGKNKLSYEEYGGLTELYQQNPQKYFDYNIVDTQLVELLEEETGLIALAITFAYESGVNFSDAFGTVGIWESILNRRLREDNIFSAVKGSPGERSSDLVGGYVKEINPIMHEWIISLDLNSLYPHLMLQYNMSPETYMPDTRQDVSIHSVLTEQYKNDSEDFAVCANGVCFSKHKLGIIPKIIEETYAARAELKTQMLILEQQIEEETDSVKKKELKRQSIQLYNAQMTIKIKMNALYGATANIYFQHYIAEMAEAITTSGQLSTMTAEKVVNAFLNKIMKTENIEYVVYCDTDSIYVNMLSIVEKFIPNGTKQEKLDFLVKIGKEKLQDILTSGFENLSTRLGAYRNAMSMKLEKVNDKALFIAKKRYILNTLYSEGVYYEKPKISVTGIESVRSSTPEVCRERMKDLFEIIMNKDESAVQDFIENFKEEFKKFSATEIGKTSGTEDIEKYSDKQTLYKKGCPIHVRGAILYNDFLKRKELQKKYPVLISGDKVKFVYLKLPNPVRENVIAFPDRMPAEFGLEQYIDYETQFEKVFLKPMETIVNAVGWSTSKISTLEDFFS